METLNIHLPFQYPVPVTWNLSFKPYLHHLEAQINQSKNTLYNAYLGSIIGMLNANPVLLKPMADWSQLEPYHELIDLIRLNYISVSDPKSIYAIGIPSPMRFFSYSESFKELIDEEDGHFKLDFQGDFIDEEYFRSAYRDILYKCYGITDFIPAASQTLFRLTNHAVVYKNIFHFVANNQFVEISCSETLPALEAEWIEYAKGNIVSHKNMMKPIPLQLFSYEGFLLFTVKDNTLEDSLNELRHNIATMHTLSQREAFRRVKANTLSLLAKDKVEVGFLPLVEVNKKILYHRFFNYTSLLTGIIKKNTLANSPDNFFERFVYNFVSLADSKVQLYNDQNKTGSEIEGIMALAGIKNFAVIPVFDQKNLVGLIELASREDQITADLIRKIEYAMPMFREFMVYQTDKLREQMEFYIKKNFSAIQPEIQWKFNEVAWQAIQYPKHVPVPEVIFRNLIPFYGAVDIRNSSLEHHQAVIEDATCQLKSMQDVLKGKKAYGTNLYFQIESWLQRINNKQADDRELELCRFVENATQAIRLRFPDSDISQNHEAEDKYEKSITAINKILKQALDIQERKLKNNTPVYFDKYRTDGWEYSVYVGQELDPGFQHPDDIISRMKKWEFETVLNMALASASIRPTLPVQLQTTQLILAQTTPVDIRFRLDEHRFDVEGSYSIRYEVIKKRIDKICIAETQQRLTQPGKIAIVYLYPQEIEAYLEAIQEYTSQGKLTDQIEYLNLEDVQGVTGLKAIRVAMK